MQKSPVSNSQSHPLRGRTKAQGNVPINTSPYKDPKVSDEDMIKQKSAYATHLRSAYARQNEREQTNSSGASSRPPRMAPQSRPRYNPPKATAAEIHKEVAGAQSPNPAHTRHFDANISDGVNHPAPPEPAADG